MSLFFWEFFYLWKKILKRQPNNNGKIQKYTQLIKRLRYRNDLCHFFVKWQTVPVAVVKCSDSTVKRLRWNYFNFVISNDTFCVKQNVSLEAVVQYLYHYLNKISAVTSVESGVRLDILSSISIQRNLYIIFVF